MIQWYDDRPSDPAAAFIYFEAIFRKQFLTTPFSEEGMKEYTMHLLIAKRELELSILPSWEFRKGYAAEDFEREMFLRFRRPFNEEIFLAFQHDVLSIIPKMKELLADPDALKAAALAHSQGNFDEALRLLPDLAERGDSVAQALLGLMYAQGQGVEKDYPWAERLYGLAILQGNKVARLCLANLYNRYARLYETGEEDPPYRKDQSEALKWLHEAAKLGDPAAQNNLGVKYERGDGVPRDYVTAYVLYSLSSEDGDVGTRGNLDRVSKLMTPMQIAEGDMLVRSQKEKDEGGS